MAKEFSYETKEQIQAVLNQARGEIVSITGIIKPSLAEWALLAILDFDVDRFNLLAHYLFGRSSFESEQSKSN